MEINKIIEIIEDNFRLSNDDYIKLMGVVQELQQHRLRRDGNAADQCKQLMEMDTA